MTMLTRVTLAFALVMTALAIAVFWPKIEAQSPDKVAATEAAIGGPFALIDHHGNQVTDQDFRGRPMLVAFGYTSCPDVCQMMLQNISESLDQVGDQAKDIAPIFISFDPERDSPAVMAEHLENFHPAIVGLTGSAKAIAEVAKAYHVYYQKAEGSEANNYIMEHSSHIYLMDTSGRYVAHFSHNVPPGNLALTLLAFLNAHNEKG